MDPEQAARVAIEVAGETLDVARPPQAPCSIWVELLLAERLSARAIREGKNLDGVVIGILEAGALTLTA